MKNNELLVKGMALLLVIIQGLAIYIFSDLNAKIKEHDNLLRKLEMSVKLIEDDIYEVTVPKKKR